MSNYLVQVEKQKYFTGAVSVQAESMNGAIAKTQERINTGALQSSGIDWNEGEYEDNTFKTTGDAEKV